MNNEIRILEDHGEDDAAWSDSESDAPRQEPPVSNPIPPPYQHALSLAPREMLPVPPASPDNPYPYRKHGISINVDSRQINSVGSLRSGSSDIASRSIKFDMVNRNVLTLSPAISTLLSHNRDSSTPKTAPPVSPTPNPNSHTFQGNGISISVRARQINSVKGLSDSVLSEPSRKELDVFNQDVPPSAPQIAAPVPTDPSPKEKYTFLEPERVSPVPGLHVECHPQDEIRDLDCAPQIAPERVSPAIDPCLCQGCRPLRSPECAPPTEHPQPMLRIVSPAPTVHSRDECVFLAPSAYMPQEARIASPTSTDFSVREASPLDPEPTCDRIGIVSEIRAASPVPPLEPGNQDVFSLPPRRTSPICAAPRAVPPSHPQTYQNELCSVPLVSCSNRREVLVNDPHVPFVSCQCLCLPQVQRSCPLVSLVPCQNLVSNHHEVRGCVPLVSCSRVDATQGNEATVSCTRLHTTHGNEATVSCSRLHAIQENQATMPFVSNNNSHETNIMLNANPPICQEDVLNTAGSKQINSGGMGLSNPVLFNTRRKMLDMLNRLHSLGIQRDIDVPSIVVVGSQSAGKSSFIESISGINLPRSGGACTRCPIECRLIRTIDGELWQCTVTLRFLTDEKGKPLDVARNITFGNTMNDPNDVEGRLRRAQLAVLNPHIPLEVFLDDNTQLEHNSSSFSSNVISLEIRSPDVTDLSFYDLPGLIASVRDGGRDEDVEDIRELVISYIRKQNCIILLTVTCEADFETQGAYRLAKKYDPEGIRTIGVLTKPDRIPEGEYSRWFKLLRNEISPLQHGWFCVKQLSTIESQKGYSFEKSRRFCERFFKTAPWDTLDASCRKRLGTKAVMAKLNEFLVSVLSERIPEITKELLKLIRDTKDRMQALPPAPSSNPLFEVVHLISQFCDNLYGRPNGFCADGADSREGFVPLSGNQLESIRGIQEKFRKAISETAPKFQPYARNSQPKYAHSHLPYGLAAEAGTTSTAAEIMYLDDVSAMVIRAVTMRQPKSHPHHVVQEFIKCYTEKWKMPALNVINDIFHVVTERQTRLLTYHFEKCTSGSLYHAVKYFNNAFDFLTPSGTDHKCRNLVNEYMQARKETLEKQVKSLINIESTAFMLNNPVFLNYKSDRLKENERIRQAYGNLDRDDFALNIIASVEAYFKVAHQRFIDSVRLAIDHKLVRIERRFLQEALYKGLNLMGSNALDNCTKLIAENVQLSNLRAELEERLERLEAVQTELLESD